MGGMLKEAWKLPVGQTPDSDYWVLDVKADEYGNYEKSLVYSCTSEVFAKQEWIYLFSKTPSLSDADHNAWIAYLDGKGVKTSDVTKVPQDGCWEDLHGSIMV